MSRIWILPVHKLAVIPHSMITSGDINKILRRVVVPTLRELGFTKFKGRVAWRYLDDSVWVFHTRAVGSYFSLVTGFPPASLTAELGIFYLDFPNTPSVEADDDGLPIPKDVHCHTRYGLDNIADQIAVRSQSMSEIERRRRDIWWVEPDGSNAVAVVEDIRQSILEYGVPLLQMPYNARSVQLERRGLARP